MPKKLSINTKAEEARARKTQVLAEKKEKQEKLKEAAYWCEAEGEKTKAVKKKEEEAEKRAQAAAKKAEVKRLAEQEERELEKYGRKVDKKSGRVAIPVPKVTAVELSRQKEEENSRLRMQAEALKKLEARTADVDEYEMTLLVPNTNRDDGIVDARSVDTALVQMSLMDELPVDRHPERRLKFSYKAFEEAELPMLKQEKPGLTHTQYKDILWKLWKKSADNPLKQASQSQQ